MNHDGGRRVVAHFLFDGYFKAEPWLNKLTPAAGERHDARNMAVIDR